MSEAQAGAGGTSGSAGSSGSTSAGNAGSMTGGASGSAGAAGSSGVAGTSGMSGSAGSAGDAGDTSSGGSAGASGNAGAGGATCTPACMGSQVCKDGTGCVDCLDTDPPRCDADNTPSQCINNTWTPQTPCGGQTPACSNGMCAGAKLNGSIVTVSTAVLSNTSVRLAEHGLEYTPTICGNLPSGTVCVSGGLRP
ncbi:MAG TPA: hypothetical protein VGI10_31305 [Polyangiaceae bacterium]